MGRPPLRKPIQPRRHQGAAQENDRKIDQQPAQRAHATQVRNRRRVTQAGIFRGAHASYAKLWRTGRLRENSLADLRMGQKSTPEANGAAKPMPLAPYRR